MPKVAKQKMKPPAINNVFLNVNISWLVRKSARVVNNEMQLLLSR